MNVVIGSLRENNYDLLKILSNETVILLQEKIEKGHCPHCWTPCEAYQNIFSNLFIRRKINGVNRRLVHSNPDKK
jgi:hypothetical protein